MMLPATADVVSRWYVFVLVVVWWSGICRNSDFHWCVGSGAATHSPYHHLARTERRKTMVIMIADCV